MKVRANFWERLEAAKAPPAPEVPRDPESVAKRRAEKKQRRDAARKRAEAKERVRTEGPMPAFDSTGRPAGWLARRLMEREKARDAAECRTRIGGAHE